MKKFLSAVIIFLVAFTVSGCDNSGKTESYEIEESNPQVTTVMVMLNKGVKFDIGLFNGPDGLLGKIKTMPQDTIRITDAKFATDLVETVDDNAVYSLQITIENTPPQEVTILTELFFLTRTHTVYNPLKLMPEMEQFTYYIGIPSSRRHSDVTTTEIARQENGDYVYFWKDASDIIFTDVFPNRTIYYVFAIAGTILAGVIIYFASRYFYCKKKNKNI